MAIYKNNNGIEILFKHYKNKQEWCNKHRYDYRIFNTETPLKFKIYTWSIISYIHITQLVSLYNVPYNHLPPTDKNV